MTDNIVMSKEFGVILEDLIKSRNLSVRQFSKDIGLKPSTVNEWIGKNGRFPSSPDIIKKLARYFEITVHELLYGEPEESSSLDKILNKEEVFSGVYEITLKKVSVSNGQSKDKKE